MGNFLASHGQANQQMALVYYSFAYIFENEIPCQEHAMFRMQV